MIGKRQGAANPGAPASRSWRLSKSVCVWMAVTGIVVAGCGSGNDPDPDVSVDPNVLSRGEVLYAESCASCHGADLQGTGKGPSFLSATYAPTHHPDEAFHRAVEQGVQPHHWQFGAMPPQEGLSSGDVEAIVAYVRQVQRDGGIARDPSHP